MTSERPDWDRLSRVERDLVAEFGADGVMEAQFCVAFLKPFEFWVWLGVPTDAERDLLRRDPALGDRTRRVVAEHGMAALYLGVDVESRQTLDRDFRGNWYLRML